MDELILPQARFGEMLAHVIGCYPEEACGLVGGLLIGRIGYGERIYPIENMLHSHVAYEMAPLPQIEAILAIEATGLELVAIYHSHPTGPARPSATDVAQAYYPEQAQLILSLADRSRPSLRAFLIADGHVREIACRIDDR